MRVAKLSLFKKLIIYNITVDRCIQLSLSTFHGTIRYLEGETNIYDTEWHRTRNGDFSDSARVGFCKGSCLGYIHSGFSQTHNIGNNANIGIKGFTT